MHRLVSTQGRLDVDFRRSVIDPLRVSGFSDAPGSMRGNLGLLPSSASFRWAVQGNFSLTAGAASIYPLEVGRHRPRSAVHRSGGLCIEVPVAPQASRRSFPCEVARSLPGLVCGEFFTAEQAVRHCLEALRRIFPAQGVQLQERILVGPETSGNRRQALSKTLESTSSPQPGSSKAAGQQQGSSPSQKAVR
ncbi:hypothetical protein NDU88_003017 [Pleurodeles waltl]|uniref:Uncharacterized protein n=1 Tax=Pleurodeles waltl TaxID=8319 RepID=A0AAV7VGR3_PLEWA|nr:hypothetical protein NDU88_003017 [Pleurodeles waltl]